MRSFFGGRGLFHCASNLRRTRRRLVLYEAFPVPRYSGRIPTIEKQQILQDIYKLNSDRAQSPVGVMIYKQKIKPVSIRN
jgi:hypothetical protein